MNTNSIQFSWDELAACSDGEWLDTGLQTMQTPGIREVITDSRCVCRDALFVALEGERFDGHDFVLSAVDHGAAVVCVADRPADDVLAALQSRAVPCLQVDDTLRAYQALGRHHRMRFSELTVVAITGSSGKTSTKEIIGSILAAHFDGEVLISEGNTNNQIGVPQNLLRLHERHRAAVLELGTNAPGEIQTLTELVNPDLAVLTNIGPVHLAGLGNMDGVAREKAGVFAGLRDRPGHAVLPHELLANPRIAAVIPHERTVTFGTASKAGVTVTYLEGDFERSRFRVERHDETPAMDIDWNISGAHQAMNAGAGFAVASILGIADDTVRRALASCRLPGMRMRTVEQNGLQWVNDAYNANPDSIRALIDWMASVLSPSRQQSSSLVLGDMLELGPGGEQLHKRILEYARQKLPTARCIAFGPHMCRAAADLDIPGFESIDELRAFLEQNLATGDTVILKGSRGMALERLLPPGTEG